MNYLTHRGCQVLPLCVIATVLLVGCSHFSDETEPAVKFQADWESIRSHEIPTWFDDAKFGVFIHWGLYSVPAYAEPTGKLHQVPWDKWFKHNAYAEWYLNTLRIVGSPTYEYHHKTHGPDFDYMDFVPKFNEEVANWNPDNMAQLFKDVHARYVVLTTKHHDGFLLWPSAIKNPNLPEGRRHAARDIVGELTESVRIRGMKMGHYYSGGLDWSFNPTPVVARSDVTGTIIHDPQYAKYADAHWRELIERYKPAILWNDIGYPETGDVVNIFADYYNRFPDGVVNNRWEVRKENSPQRHRDFVTPEYKTMEDIHEDKWETCRGMGYSFGYNRVEGQEQTIAEDELIHLLIDVTAKNGNLLLNVGPKANGSIPEIQKQRLRALGGWLDINGEAIFGTRPWTKASGQTDNGIDLRFTRKGETLYVILLSRPGGDKVAIKGVAPAEGAQVNMLGAGECEWNAKTGGLTIKLPERYADAHAYTFKISKVQP